MGIVKKIFEHSKGKKSQKDRRKFINELIKCNNACKFENKINNEGEIKELFGKDEKKSDTLKFIKRIRDLVNDLKGNKTDKEKFITDLLNGKIPDGKKPSSIATITSNNCKEIGKKILELYGGFTLENPKKIFLFDIKCATKELLQKLSIEHIHLSTDIPNSFFSNMEKILSVKIIGQPELGKNAFKNCSSLYRVVFNITTREIGDDFFAGCDSLREIDYCSNIEDSIIENIKKSVKSGNFKKEVAGKLKIKGKTVEELKNL